MAFPFIAVAVTGLIAVRSAPRRLRAVSGTETARNGGFQQQGQQSLGFASCGGHQSRSGQAKPNDCACRHPRGGYPVNLSLFGDSPDRCWLV